MRARTKTASIPRSLRGCLAVGATPASQRRSRAETNERSEVRIELERLPEHERSEHLVACGICECLFYLGPVIAHAYDDDGTDWREVCPVFLWGGADGIVERLRDRASWYARMAEDFAEAADEGVENVPTAEELRLFSELLA